MTTLKGVADSMAHAAGDGHGVALAAAWASSAPPAAYPPLKGEVEAETVIVGAGLTGLSTAVSLAEHGRSVVVLEAGQPGAGASGASGGQVIPGLRHFPDELMAKYGRERGKRAFDFGAEAADRTFDLIGRHDISCDAVRGGKVQVADSAAGLVEAERRARHWQGLGAPVELLDADGVEQLTGTRAYGGGWIDRRGGTVQPLALARGLAARASAGGAQIYGATGARRVTRQGASWRVETPEGHVLAPNLLLATNAATDGLWPGLQQAFLKVWSFQIATQPLPPTLRAGTPPHGQAVSDTRRVISYFRTDADGRLIVGGKGLGRAPRRTADFDFQRLLLRRLYPQLADHPLEYAWGGQVCITLDRLPRIVRLGEGAYAHLGCNGKGVAWCTAIGASFAEAFVTNDPNALPIPATGLRTIPFHQLRELYLTVGGAWLRARDALEGMQPRSGARQ